MSENKPLPRLEVFAEEMLGNRLGSGVYRKWVEGLDLRGNEHVVDFGCGAGACARHLAAAVPAGRVTAIDLDERWLEVARKRLRSHANVDIRQADICAWQPDATYDVATLHFVLHDIPAQSRPEAVRTIASALRPGGRLCIREPLSHGMSEAEMEGVLAMSGMRLTGVKVHGSLPGMGPTVSEVWEKSGASVG